MDVGLWIGIVTVALAVAGFFIGLGQYKEGQRWKRTEFLAEEMKDFRQDAKVQTALLLLDWRQLRAGDLPEAAAGPGDLVGDDDLAGALVPHEEKGGHFTEREYWLRGVFDALFDRLERYAHYVDNGLIDVEDLSPYLGYWLANLAGQGETSKRGALLGSIHRYIDAYFDDVRRLLDAHQRSQEGRGRGRRAKGVPAVEASPARSPANA